MNSTGFNAVVSPLAGLAPLGKTKRPRKYASGGDVQADEDAPGAGQSASGAGQSASGAGGSASPPSGSSSTAPGSSSTSGGLDPLADLKATAAKFPIDPSSQDQARERLQSLTDRLNQIASTPFRPVNPLMSFAAGMLGPTKTGSFGESLGNAITGMNNTETQQAYQTRQGQILGAQAGLRGAEIERQLAADNMKTGLGLQSDIARSQIADAANRRTQAYQQQELALRGRQLGIEGARLGMMQDQPESVRTADGTFVGVPRRELYNYLGTHPGSQYIPNSLAPTLMIPGMMGGANPYGPAPAGGAPAAPPAGGASVHPSIYDPPHVNLTPGGATAGLPAMPARPAPQPTAAGSVMPPPQTANPAPLTPPTTVSDIPPGASVDGSPEPAPDPQASPATGVAAQTAASGAPGTPPGTSDPLPGGVANPLPPTPLVVDPSGKVAGTNQIQAPSEELLRKRQENAEKEQAALDNMLGIRNSWDPSYSTIQTQRLKMPLLNLRDRLGALPDGPEKDQLAKFTTWQARTADAFNEQSHDLYGARLTQTEIDRATLAKPTTQDGPTEFINKLDDGILFARLGRAREQITSEQPGTTHVVYDPKTGAPKAYQILQPDGKYGDMTLGGTVGYIAQRAKQMADQLVQATQKANPNISPVSLQAQRMAAIEAGLKTYGLTLADLNRYYGNRSVFGN